MRIVRTLLALLLCLSVSTAGWASVGGVPSCEGSGQHSAHAGGGSHHHPVHARGVALAGHHHHHHHHASAGDHHVAHASAGDCKGSGCHHTCPCGCGAGTCVPAFAPLVAVQPTLILASPPSVIAPLSQQLVNATPNTALLRPPIS